MVQRTLSQEAIWIASEKEYITWSILMRSIDEHTPSSLDRLTAPVEKRNKMANL